MFVVKENEITDSMYMIHTGSVEEVAEDLEEQTQVLHDGDNFGIVRYCTYNLKLLLCIEIDIHCKHCLLKYKNNI